MDVAAWFAERQAGGTHLSSCYAGISGSCRLPSFFTAGTSRTSSDSPVHWDGFWSGADSRLSSSTRTARSVDSRAGTWMTDRNTTGARHPRVWGIWPTRSERCSLSDIILMSSQVSCDQIFIRPCQKRFCYWNVHQPALQCSTYGPQVMLQEIIK